MINEKIFTSMMDEQLIDEVAQHSVIFNRQKYYLNGSNAGMKYETKDEAWQLIAIKLHTDVETCKKRWKYLRERYVSQRKQGDPPVYEHLSRPYLEKMKFLDQHIQPRKSYRNVTSFLSPHSATSSYSEYNMDSKSNNSIKDMAHFGNVSQHSYPQQDPQHAMNALSSAAAAALESANGQVKIETDQVFRDFAVAVASQQFQHISQSQIQHQQAAAAAAAMADSSQNFTQQFRDGVDTNLSLVLNTPASTCGVASSSSSLKSPLSSPIATVNGNATTTRPTSTPQQVAAHSSSATHSASLAASTISNNASSINNNNHNQNNNQQLPAHEYDIDSNNDGLDSSTARIIHITKKPRVSLGSATTTTTTNGTNHQQPTNTNGVVNNNNHNSHTHSHFVDDTDDDSDENSRNMLQLQQDNRFNNLMGVQRNGNSMGSNNHIGNQQQAPGMFTTNADILFQLYNQLPTQASTSQQTNFNKFQTPQNPLPLPQRSSEHLLGELVTTELLKMSKERRKNVQKRILEILFFDD